MTYKISYLNKAIICLSLLAGCLLQVQWDMFETATYAGLRFNLADFLLPVAGLLIIVSLIKKQSEWPVYKIPYTYGWLTAMTAVLLLSLYTGYLHQGKIPQWGLHNKITGWFVLIAYFLWGAWFAYNGKSIKIYKFFRVMTIFALAVCTIGSIVITAQDFKLLNGVIAYPFKGLMANRNALGFLMLSVTTLVFFYGNTQKPLLGGLAEKFFWTMLPLIHVQIGSRSCWILLIIQIVAFILINRGYFLKSVAPSFALGCAIVALLTVIHNKPNEPHFIFKQRQNVQFVQLPGLLNQLSGQTDLPVDQFPSDLLRLKVNGFAIELWAENPILGSGLGTTQFEEPRKFGEFLDVIDSTPVWILCETGLVGIMIFAGFFWLIVFTLSRELKNPNKYIQTVNSLALGIFLTFAIMSVMHELLYTRFMWFILGIAITVPAAAIRMHQAQEEK
ncbi:MAG: hypothetical protein DI586_08520 [Micavibrio aeruginosavorus]|uniref:O-antigen ligase-related domain-containing protein n=1 Tax=Micavibrio aeruginosavorus TaxID=349221 RepID=A0A2W5FFX6_9BACT|nr:MAG: hypothetical protein DI586_08520 [Micavibrio aeruginosavorus]